MKAIIQTGYGSPDNFELRDLDKPEIMDSEVLVKVHSCSVNAGDVYVMRGVPRMVKITAGMPKPKMYIPGYDFAGIVEAVGSKVTRFQPGDEVYGGAQKTFAEYIGVKEKNLSMKPDKLSFEQAAAIPTAAVTALQGVKNAGKVEEGQKVLINGASGGVGTFAVQIAKAFGAEVTGVCSTRHKEMLHSIGTDHIIDYTENDFTKGTERYDLILDQVANHSLAACRRVLTPKGKHIPNSGNSGLAYILKATIASMFYRKQGGAYFAAPKREDLDFLNDLIADRKLMPVIDKVFSLSDTVKAFHYMEEVHPSGKVVIKVQ